MKKRAQIIPTAGLESRILTLRGQKVMLESDLAVLHGVTTKRLNEQVKRNAKRFPADFIFRLTPMERKEVVANCDHLLELKFSPVLPYAFTENGAIMAASVLNSDLAIRMSVFVVRAFIRMRELLTGSKELAAAPDAGERFLAKWQGAFKLDPAALKDERVAAIMAKHGR